MFFYMKFIIGICEDEELVAGQLKRIILDCLKELGREADVHIYHSGRELLENIEEVNVIFLDVCMKDMDGYETGKHIRRIKPDCRIIMETGESEYFEKAFEIGAFRYIKKPFEKAKILEALNSMAKGLAGIDGITLYKGRNKYDIEQRSIEYIRAYNGYTEYYIGGEIFRKEISLRRIEEELDRKLFFRVHKQYVINMKFIEGKQDGRVRIGGIEIPVSRRQRSKFDKAYLDYLFSV